VQGVLQDLRASRCSGLTEVHIHTPASHPLAELDLSACHFLRLVDLGLPHLRSLNLSTCRTLYRLRLRCVVVQTFGGRCCDASSCHEGWRVAQQADALLLPPACCVFAPYAGVLS
jgi:hypothetical protein